MAPLYRGPVLGIAMNLDFFTWTFVFKVVVLAWGITLPVLALLNAATNYRNAP